MSFASSVCTDERHDPTRAMKIFWLPASESKEDVNNSFSVEDVQLPPVPFRALRNALVESAELLPESSKKFQEWNVGLLERFSARDVVRKNRPPD